MSSLVIRPANEDECPLILEFIRGIAAYERLLDQVEATTESLRKALFLEKTAHCDFAVLDHKPIAFAIWFYNFSTFVGKKGLYLEDLYVLPDYRHQGIGNALLESLIKRANSEDCGRMEWTCLEWNETAKAFYRAKGAKSMTDWRIWRMSESSLKRR